MHQYENTSNPLPELKFDVKRRRVKYCPCGRSNRDGKFAPYIGYADKGYCHSCGETFLPELLEQGALNEPASRRKKVVKPISLIEERILEQTLRRYEHNHFTIYLESVFGKEVTSLLMRKYYVGTSKKWYGATVFSY